MSEHRRLTRTDVPWWPGSWQPGMFGIADSIAITMVLIVLALVRGVDYLSPVHSLPASRDSLSVVEAAFPLPVWGLAFILPALLLSAAVALRVHAGVWLGHWLLGIAYVALAVGLGVEFLGRPWFEGIRSATSMTLPAAIHVAVAVRTGWRPPRWIRIASPD